MFVIYSNWSKRSAKHPNIVTLFSGRCAIERAWLLFLSIESRSHQHLAECELSLPKPFRDSPVSNTKMAMIRTFESGQLQKIPIEFRQSFLQCSTADCYRIAFRQCLIIPNMATVFNGQIPSASVHCTCLVTVWTLSGHSRSNREAVGTDSIVFTMQKLQIE